MLKNFVLPAECLLRASHFVSNEETRGYLKTVCLDAGILCATTGHYLYAEELPEAKAMAIIERQTIPLDKPFLAALKPAKRDYQTRYVVGIHHDVNRLDLFVTLAADPQEAMSNAEKKENLLFSWHTSRPEGEFPDWRRVFPHWDKMQRPTALDKNRNPIDPPCGRIHEDGFNPAYLGLFAKVSDCIRLIPQIDSCSPYGVQFADLPQAYGLIMPIRCTMDWKRCPDWLHRVASPETPAEKVPNAA